MNIKRVNLLIASSQNVTLAKSVKVSMVLELMLFQLSLNISNSEI